MVSNELKQFLARITLSHFEFNNGLGEFEEFFDQKFADNKRDWFYRQVYQVSKDEWIEFCKSNCGRFDRLPTVKQILELGASLFRNAKARRIEMIEEFYTDRGVKRCKLCDHTGIISATKNGRSEGVYAFRCGACEFSLLRQLSLNIKAWEPHLETFFTPLYKQVLKPQFNSQEEYDQAFDDAFEMAIAE